MRTETSKKKHHLGFYIVSFVGLILLGGAVFWMSLNRREALSEELETKAKNESRGPLVNVVRVQVTPGEKTLNLLGEARPLTEATIYAKLSGYLRRIYVDKGDPVRAGQVLARIESPETDQAYLAAQADWVNKSRIARRMKVLEARKLISPQEAEQAYAAADISKAQLHTQSVLRGYETLKAPFDGVVTARYADPGDLIQNGANSQAASLAVVTVSQNARLRIYVYVDQRNAPSVKVGLPVQIYLPDRPDRVFHATVGRLADELDPRTRMLLTEVEYDNSKHDIVSGSFVVVELKIAVPRALQVPVAALVFRGQKTFLAVVGQDSKVHFQPATILDDDGITAVVSSNVRPGTLVALALGPNVGDNTRVQMARQQTAQNVSVARGQPFKRGAR